jgi:hypothetical protein
LASNYYKSLFGLGPRNMFDINTNLWQPAENVTSQENEDLTKPFLEEEIRHALFQMKKIRQQDLMASLLSFIRYVGLLSKAIYVLCLKTFIKGLWISRD